MCGLCNELYKLKIKTEISINRKQNLRPDIHTLKILVSIFLNFWIINFIIKPPIKY